MRAFIPHLAYCSIALLLAFSGTLIQKVTPRYPAGLVVAEGSQWEKRSLRVCWREDQSVEASPYFIRDYGAEAASKLIPPPLWVKEIVRNAVTREYRQERVGIDFVGWERCQRAVAADIQLLFASHPEASLRLVSQPADARVGAGGRSSHLGREHVESGEISPALSWEEPLYLYFSYYTDRKLLGRDPIKEGVPEYASKQLSFLAIHEFGHMVGLIHEGEDDTRSVSGHRPRRVTPFDRESVMWLSQEPKLSEGDVHGLRCLYILSAQEKAEKCVSPPLKW
jgi:hypothetical protein